MKSVFFFLSMLIGFLGVSKSRPLDAPNAPHALSAPHAALVPSHPVDENAAKKHVVIAVPPVATSILSGPYLEPGAADNQIFLPHRGYHSSQTGLHFSHGLYTHGHYYTGYHSRLPFLGHAYPHHTHYYRPYGGVYGHPHPFMFHHPGITRIPVGYHNSVPLGMVRHYNSYHGLWPHMDVSGPVSISDPNDGLYQVPTSGALIPRPIMPHQYPVLLDHSSNMAGENGPGVVFLGGGTMKSAIPVDPVNVENQILENSANLHDSPAHEVEQQISQMGTGKRNHIKNHQQKN